MMKITCQISFILILFLSPTLVFSQNALAGVYSYKFKEGTYFFKEEIILHPNGCFNYKMQSIMGLNIEIAGNWQKRNSYLILDSSPQRDKIIVREFFNKKRKGMTFNVEDKEGRPFSYHLYAIRQNGDTLSFDGQFDPIIIQEKIKSFWIMDTKGLKSPQYMIKSNLSDVINVIFELQRVFENEKWQIINDENINPIGLDGQLSNYYLTKNMNIGNTD